MYSKSAESRMPRTLPPGRCGTTRAAAGAWLAWVIVCLAANPIPAAEPPTDNRPASQPASESVPQPAAQPATRPTGDAAPQDGDPLVRLQNAVERLVERIGPSVVTIEARRSLLEKGEGAGSPNEAANWTSHGAGVILRDEGMILTSQHVINGAGTINVVLSDGRRHRAVLIAADRRSDLAVLRVNAADMPAAQLGDAAAVRRGHLVLAFGNPLGLAGDGPAAASLGVVSAIGRPLPETLGREEDRYYGDMIQTSLPTSPGDSGGPLVDIHGCVIGIMTAMGGREGEEQGLGFAVPIDARTKAIIERLLHGEQIEYGYIGVQVGTPTEAQRKAAGLDAPNGAVVKIVLADGPALRAGLRPGDIIMAIDGQEVSSGGRFVQLVGGAPPGRVVELTLMRQSQRQVIRVELARRESAPDRPASRRTISFRGAMLNDVDPSTIDAGNLPAHALIVVLVHEGFPADRAGLTPGDVVVQVQGKPVTADSGKLLIESTGEVLLGLANGGSVLVKSK